MKEQETQEKPRQRKARAERGTRDQKMMNFRIDMENADWLATQPNKGRAVNEAIRQYRRNLEKPLRREEDPMKFLLNAGTL